MMMSSDNGLLPGFRLSPSDGELIHILLTKVRKEPTGIVNPIDIRNVDLYEKEPWMMYKQLNISESESIENNFYFFTQVKNKNKKGNNKMERVVGSGQWSIQGKKDVLDPFSGRRIGWKKTFNFQVNKKNCNPSWIMHEYTLVNCDSQAICRIGRNAVTKKKLNNEILQQNPIKSRSSCDKNKRCPVSKHQDSHSGSMLDTSRFETEPLSHQPMFYQQQPCEPSSSNSSCQSQQQQPFSFACSSNSALSEQNLYHQYLQTQQLPSDPTTSSNSMLHEDLDHCETEGYDQGLGDEFFYTDDMLRMLDIPLIQERHE